MKQLKFFISIVFVLMMVGCMDHIEDTNGDDTTLETFTMTEKVEGGSYSSRYSLSSSKFSGGTTYCLNYEEEDYDVMEYSYDLFSGTAKVHCSDMDAGEVLVLTISTTLTEGNLEIAVVGPNKTIVETVLANETKVVTISSTVEGNYFVVVGGESAKFELDINRQIN